MEAVSRSCVQPLAGQFICGSLCLIRHRSSSQHLLYRTTRKPWIYSLERPARFKFCLVRCLANRTECATLAWSHHRRCQPFLGECTWNRSPRLEPMNVFRRASIDVGGRWSSLNIQVIRFFISLPRFLYYACCFWFVDPKAAYGQDHRSHAHMRRPLSPICPHSGH